MKGVIKGRGSVVFAGTFDPLTLGHEDIIQRACNAFSNVYVIVSNNPTKKTLFTLEQRIGFVEQFLYENNLINARARTISDDAKLLVNECKRLGIETMIRGIRNEADFAYEMTLGSVNRSQDPGIDTVYFMTHPHFTHVSSSNAKELARLGGNIRSYVNSHVLKAVENAMGMG